MKKSFFLPAGWLLFLAAAAGFGVLEPAEATPVATPNIIFILTDDLGWGDVGVFYQNSRNFAVNRNKPAFATPKLDTMAAEGMQLRRHYCPAPVCAPSRASLLLGVHQGHANVRDDQFDKALADNHTLASVLKQAGYATAAFGKWGLGGAGTIPEAHPQYRGFDYFFGYMTHADGHYHYPKENGQTVWNGFSTSITSQLGKCYTPDLWTARAKKWIVDHEATNPAQPFFIYLAYDSPHARLQVPTTAYPAGGGTNGGVLWAGTSGAMINTATGTIDSWIHPDYKNATWDDDNNSSTAEVAWPAAEKRHATMIRRLDDNTADLLQLLKDLNLDTNTLVVFTSDNGPHNEAGNGGTYIQDPTFFASFGPMDGIKRDSWEGGMREPTIVRWPGHVPAGTTNFSVSQFQDWMPTFAELAGLPAPARTDGVSLVPTLTGNGSQRESTVYVEYYYSGATPGYSAFEVSRRGETRNQEQAIYLDGYKGIRYDVTASTDDFQIYETLNDPKETTDLAASSSYFTNLQQRMKDRVLQVRRPGGGVTRPYDSALVPSVTVAGAVTAVTGLDYRAFEDSYPWVPDFTTLAAMSNGSCSGVNLSVRTRNDNIGLCYTGYLDVPSDGTYTIYLTTDSRAFLRLHDAIVIAADFGYVGGTEISAAINLKSGRHPLRLGYVRGTGGTPSLSLQWSGPGIVKQAIPAANLLHVGTAVAIPPTAADDSVTTTTNTPVAIGVLANDSAGSGPGPLRIVSVALPANGFATTNTLNQIIYTPNPGFVGINTFNYTMTDGNNYATATVTVAVVTIIPPTAADDSATTAQNTPVTVNVLANDGIGSSSGPLRVVSVGMPQAGTATTNVSGQIIYTPSAGFLGNDSFTYAVTDGGGTATATVHVSVTFSDGMLWFPFNQTSGLTTADAGGAFTASLLGFANDPAEWVAGKWNRAVQFDGTDNYISIANYTGILGSGPRTVAAWVKTTSTAQQPVIAWGPNSAGNKWTFLVQGGHARIEITSGYLEGTRTVNDGQWHFIACTYTNNFSSITNAKLYVDGVVETSFADKASLAVNTTSFGNVRVGSDVQSRFFNGTIDEPRIYNRALIAAEIGALYAATNQSAAAWHRRYYGNAAVNWTVTDSTGSPRLLDYAFGSEPGLFAPPQLSVRCALVTNTFQMQFPRRVAGTSELIYQLQSSPDLQNWSPWSAVELPAMPLATPGMESVTFQSIDVLTNASFIRLRVSLP